MATYFDIFNEPYNPFSTLEESTDYLLKACDRYDVLNLSYWFLGKSLQFPDRMTWLSTYSPDYMSVYLREFSPHGDPVFSICFDRLLPLDWAGLRMTDATAKIIHHTAEQYGVGHQGISFPIRDVDFGEAMFSINSGCDDRHWEKIRGRLANVFHLFAHYFHLRMRDIISGRPYSAEFDLSPREREVLLWAASGKTAWETASLIGVSERAIRLYTANAMTKLHAHTKTQAVAIAVRNGILQ